MDTTLKLDYYQAVVLHYYKETRDINISVVNARFYCAWLYFDIAIKSDGFQVDSLILTYDKNSTSAGKSPDTLIGIHSSGKKCVEFYPSFLVGNHQFDFYSPDSSEILDTNLTVASGQTLVISHSPLGGKMTAELKDGLNRCD